MNSTNKILWMDTETTGLSAEKHGIVSLAALFDIDGEIVETIDIEMKPTGRISDPGALKTNGYNHSKIKRFTPWEKVFPDFIHQVNSIMIKHYPDFKFTLAGQNIPFDNRFVCSWANYCKAFEYWDILVYQDNFIDTKNIAKKFPEITSKKLGNLCKYFGVKLDNAHNAMADIEATRNLYYVMQDRLEDAKQPELGA